MVPQTAEEVLHQAREQGTADVAAAMGTVRSWQSSVLHEVAIARSGRSTVENGTFLVILLCCVLLCFCPSSRSDKSIASLGWQENTKMMILVMMKQ